MARYTQRELEELAQRYPLLELPMRWRYDLSREFAPELRDVTFAEVEHEIARAVEYARMARTEQDPKLRGLFEQLVISCETLAVIGAHFAQAERAARVSREYALRMVREIERIATIRILVL